MGQLPATQMEATLEPIDQAPARVDLLVFALIIAIADDVLNDWSATLGPRGGCR